MHALALQLTPVLAAEKSKTAFYVAGGLLVAWALIVSLLLGLNRPRFPSTLRGQRTVMAISAVLVIATVAAAVATASPPAKESSATSGAQPAAAAPGAAPSPAPSATSPAAPAASAAAPGATTSAPAAAKPATGSSLSLAASPAGLLAYNTKTLSAKAGSVTINFTNVSPLEHNVTIAEGGKVIGATPTFSGGSRKLTLNLKPGTYVFYCSVPGHRQAGMEGTLNVS